jgi:hypothetical protein
VERIVWMAVGVLRGSSLHSLPMVSFSPAFGLFHFLIPHRRSLRQRQHLQPHSLSTILISRRSSGSNETHSY